MPDFPTALNDALRGWYPPPGGIRSPVSSHRGQAARMAALERSYGSKKAAAAAAGIGASTWRAWTTHGTSHRPPSAASQRKLDDAYRSLLRAVQVRRTPRPTTMNIYALVVADPNGSRYVNRTPERMFKAEKGGVGPAVDAWLRGDSPDQVAAAALDGIAAAYGTRFAFEGENVYVDLQ